LRREARARRRAASSRGRSRAGVTRLASPEARRLASEHDTPGEQQVERPARGRPRRGRIHEMPCSADEAPAGDGRTCRRQLRVLSGDEADVAHQRPGTSPMPATRAVDRGDHRLGHASSVNVFAACARTAAPRSAVCRWRPCSRIPRSVAAPFLSLAVESRPVRCRRSPAATACPAPAQKPRPGRRSRRFHAHLP